MEVSVVKLNF